MARPGLDGKRVPDADRMVARTGRQPGAIGAEGHRMHITIRAGRGRASSFSTATSSASSPTGPRPPFGQPNTQPVCTLTAVPYVTELARGAPAAIFSAVPRSIRGMIDCRIVDYARMTARVKEAISWPLKQGPMRDW
jgi:hypothetical protein